MDEGNRGEISIMSTTVKDMLGVTEKHICYMDYSTICAVQRLVAHSETNKHVNNSCIFKTSSFHHLVDILSVL